MSRTPIASGVTNRCVSGEWIQNIIEIPLETSAVMSHVSVSLQEPVSGHPSGTFTGTFTELNAAAIVVQPTLQESSFTGLTLEFWLQGYPTIFY